MIEFVVKNRRLRYYPDGTITCRAIRAGRETKKELWNEVQFCICRGYLVCNITIDNKPKLFYKHRIVYLAHNPTWDIFDGSLSNCIDHINRDRTDNSLKNLRVVTGQQNAFNKSNIRGYYWDKDRKKWRVAISLNNKTIHIGLFEKEEDAYSAYIEAKERLHIIPEN